LLSKDSLAPIIATVFTEIAPVFTPLRPPDSNGVVETFFHLVAALLRPICRVVPAILAPLHARGLAKPKDRDRKAYAEKQDHSHLIKHHSFHKIPPLRINF
jgi:hypothetical protein